LHFFVIGLHPCGNGKTVTPALEGGAACYEPQADVSLDKRDTCNKANRLSGRSALRQDIDVLHRRRVARRRNRVIVRMRPNRRNYVDTPTFDSFRSPLFDATGRPAISCRCIGPGRVADGQSVRRSIRWRVHAAATRRASEQAPWRTACALISDGINARNLGLFDPGALYKLEYAIDAR
jgi:hypothetical protein